MKIEPVVVAKHFIQAIRARESFLYQVFHLPTLATLLTLTLITPPLVAEECPASSTNVSTSHIALYGKAGGAINNFGKEGQSIVFFGGGGRFWREWWATDLSFQKGEKYWSGPRVQRLYYWRPDRPSSLYLGGGLSYAKIRAHDRRFSGIAGEATVGFAFLRDHLAHLLLECTLTQPLLRFNRKPINHPTITFSVGASFQNP